MYVYLLDAMAAWGAMNLFCLLAAAVGLAAPGKTDNLHVLREKRKNAVTDMRGLLELVTKENRDMSEEELKKFDGLDVDQKKLSETIGRMEGLETIEQALEQVRPAGARPTQIIPGAPAKREFETMSEFLHAVRFNPNDQRLQFDANASVNPVGIQGAQRMDEGATGGFAVPTQFLDRLLSVDPQVAIIRSRATVIPAGSPPDAAIEIPALDQTTGAGAAPSNVYGGVAMTWLGEGAAKPETSYKIRQIKLEPKELAGHILVNDKLLRNWPACSALTERLMRGALVSAEEHAFLTGNGAAKPLGLVPSAAAFGVARTTSTEVHYADVTAMLARMIDGGSPAWIASKSVLPQLLAMRNTIGSPAVGDGALIWQPNARDAAGNLTLLGYPIFWHQRSPALGTKGDLALVDLAYYLIKDGSGPFVRVLTELGALNNQTYFVIFTNVDGQPWLSAPFTQEDNYQVSPFVVLDVPA